MIARSQRAIYYYNKELKKERKLLDHTNKK